MQRLGDTQMYEMIFRESFRVRARPYRIARSSSEMRTRLSERIFVTVNRS
jgi:hypothetical protein